MKSSMVQAVLKIFLDIPETVKKVVEKRLHSEGLCTRDLLYKIQKIKLDFCG